MVSNFLIGISYVAFLVGGVFNYLLGDAKLLAPMVLIPARLIIALSEVNNIRGLTWTRPGGVPRICLGGS